MANINKAPIIISIEGNIGSGKSTFVEHLKHAYTTKNGSSQDINICFLQEPVDEWNSITDEHGESMLSKFYTDSKKYAFPFQMMAYISRLALLRDAIKKSYDIIVTERCVQTDKNVFAQMLYDDGKMEEVEFAIYNRWFDEFINDIPEIYTIYLETDPKVAKQRVDKRARNGEAIPLEYLTSCHNYHDKWLSSKSPSKIKKINVNLDTDTYFDAIAEWISEAKYFIGNLVHLDEVPPTIRLAQADLQPLETHIKHDKQEYTLMFDGGSRGNPGICGAGHVILLDNQLVSSGSAIVSTNNTNNYAEYMSLINGLNDAHEKGMKCLIVKGDSQLVIKQVQGNWKVGAPSLQNLHAEVVDKITLFDSVTFHHVLHGKNKLADAEANKAMDSYEKITNDI